MSQKPSYNELEKRVAELEKASGSLKSANSRLRQKVSRLNKERQSINDERKILFSVLDQLPAYVYLKTQNHTIKFANNYFKEHFGAAVGKQCYNVFENRDTPCEDCSSYSNNEVIKPHVWTHEGARIYQTQTYPISDADRSPLILKFGFDITGQKVSTNLLQENTT